MQETFLVLEQKPKQDKAEFCQASWQNAASGASRSWSQEMGSPQKPLSLCPPLCDLASFSSLSRPAFLLFAHPHGGLRLPTASSFRHFCSSLPLSPILPVSGSQIHMPEKENMIDSPRIRHPDPVPSTMATGARSHRRKMAPQHRWPAPRVDRSCDAWNGQNAFEAHLTALQKGWKPRGRLFSSFELNFVSG